MRNDYLDYLMHYGVIGMRWGHRKDKGEVAYTKLVKDRPLKSNSFYHDNKIQRLDSKSAVKNVQSAKTPQEKEKAVKEANKTIKEVKEKGKSWISKIFNKDKNDNNDKSEKSNDKPVVKSIFEQSVKVGKDKPKISISEKVVSTGEKGVDDLIKLRNLRDEHRNNRSAAQSLKNISTDDLKMIVSKARERKALEDDYTRLVVNTVSSGRQRTTETLETIGAVLAVTGSAVTIISAINSFKKKE